MMKRVLDFPIQLIGTSKFIENQTSKLSTINVNSGNISRVVLVGMGGSGIIGDFIRVLLRKSKVSVHICKSSIAPRFALEDEKSLIIAITYSGKTAETLNSLKTMISNGNN